MTILNDSKPSLEDTLQHHGVKGMKWGVRKQKTLDTYSRVATGKGSLLDKAKVASTTTARDLARNEGSLKKVAGTKANQLEKQKARIESGKATVRDKLERAMLTPMTDLVRGR